MNNSSDLTTPQSQQEYTETRPSSKGCGHGESNAHSAPVGAAFWEATPSDVSLPEIFSHLHQLTGQPGMVDPIIFSSVPGSPTSSHPSVISSPWFISEPILCSIMVGGLHAPVANITVPHLTDNHQVHQGMTEVPSYTTQPVVSNISDGKQVVDFCEPGPVFHSLECVPTHRVRGKDVNVSRIPNQLPQYYQTSYRLPEPRDRIASIYPRTFLKRAADTVRESKSKKPCHCTRSECLKLYCECFASGVMCSNCDCSNCCNNAEHETKRHKAIKFCLGRNPDAFRPKFAGGKSEVKGWQKKGCNCKRSGCLKNYCECYEAAVLCTSSCKCIGCGNFRNSSEMGLSGRTDKAISSASVITPAVVEAVCDRLLAQADRAEKEALSHAHAEHRVLNEFGHCLTQIVNSIFKE